MYSEQLKTLIKNILADGVITDKERTVLHKKAEAEGVDIDEIDVYIDGELDKIRNEQMKTKAQVRKCPTCGEIIPALTNICPSCGAAFNEKKDDELYLKIRRITDKTKKVRQFSKRKEEKYGWQWNEFSDLVISCENEIREITLLYGDNRKVRSLITNLEKEIDTAHKIQISHNKIHKVVKIVKISIMAACILIPILLCVILGDHPFHWVAGGFVMGVLGGVVGFFLCAGVDMVAQELQYW